MREGWVDRQQREGRKKELEGIGLGFFPNSEKIYLVKAAFCVACPSILQM